MPDIVKEYTVEPGELIEQAERIIASHKDGSPSGTIAEGMEFLRVHAGQKSAFFKNLEKVYGNRNETLVYRSVISNLNSFIDFVRSGLHQGVSIERRARVDVVSDFLDQANTLVNTNGVHPAAPIVLIGAALEEFLRNWVEDQDLTIGNRKPSIDAYSKSLKEAGVITKQDDKDITSWAGLRNSAAHGEWDAVSDKKRAQIMLEAVNLFMRKYGAKE